MDFVEGLDLARVLERHGRLSVPDACEAVRQAALGLQHAFERGLVHRDVKPSNLLLASGGRVQVLDLGLARSFAEAAADTMTARDMVLGTPDYLAPEQWEHAHAADHRADIYSLGCTLYHLLAGRPPFAGERYHFLPQKMRAHLETPPAPIAEVRPEVPAGLAAVLDRMLAKGPAQRFQSHAEVAEALRPFTAGSDLAAVVGADAAASAPGGSPCAAVPTPAPGLWETASDRTGRGSHLPVPRSPYAVPVSLAGLFLLIVAAWLLWPRGGGSPTPAAARPLEIKELRITHYRNDGDKKEKVLLGDLRKSSEPVRLNDRMGIAADLTAPAYYYLIAFNPKGSEAGTMQLCQPEDADGRALEEVRPEQLTEVRYSQYFIPDAVGLQAIVLAASTKLLPPFKEWRAEVPWEGVKDGGAWTWHFDGREFIRLPQDRGKVEPKGGVPESFRKLCEFFKGRREFDSVQAIAFPVADEQK
jgi:hypothetical protein